MKNILISILFFSSLNTFAEKKLDHTFISFLSVGYFHSCVIFNNDQGKCWGDNANGQLGILSDLSKGAQVGSIQTLPYIALNQNEKIQQLSTGNGHTCALLNNNKIKCWGSNDMGILGQGNDFPRGIHPLSMGKNLPITNLGNHFLPLFIGSGMFHNCALSDVGTVKCWGQNAFGQLGLENTKAKGYYKKDMGNHLHTLDFGNNKRHQKLLVKKLSVGYVHNCAIFTNKKAKCWGNNKNGELAISSTKSAGDTKNSMGKNLSYVSFNKQYNKENMIFKSISAGYAHSCAIIDIPQKKEFGKIICWGNNSYGQLGQGNEINLGTNKQTSSLLKPIVFKDDVPAIKVVTAMLHTCALFKNNKVRCWGRNDDGHLGLGHMKVIGNLPGQIKKVPYLKLGKGKVIDIQAKGAFSCVTLQVLNRLKIKCWGLDAEGALGLERGSQDSPVGTKPEDMGENLKFINF